MRLWRPIATLCSFVIFLFGSSLLSSADEYDRLDGRGSSQGKVDIVEWENNLEVQISPSHALLALGAKLDPSTRNRKVLVLEYKFANGIKLVRRAILGIELKTPLEAKTKYRGEQRIITFIGKLGSSNDRGETYALAAEPRQLYPTEALAEASNKGTGTPDQKAPATTTSPRDPASTEETKESESQSALDSLWQF